MRVQQTLLTECVQVKTKLQTPTNVETCFLFPGHERELPRCIVGETDHIEQLRFREQALVTLSMLGDDVVRYGRESTQLNHLTSKLTNGMPEKSHLDANMGTDTKETLHRSRLANGHVTMTTVEGQMSVGEERHVRGSKNVRTSLTRSGSVKHLIHKFSTSNGDGQASPSSSPGPSPRPSPGSSPGPSSGPSPRQSPTSLSPGESEGKQGQHSSSIQVKDVKPSEVQSVVPTVTITPPSGQMGGGGVSPAAGVGLLPNGAALPVVDIRLDTEKNRESPASEEEPSTPRTSPKYQIFLADMHGASGPGGPNSPATSTNGSMAKNSLSHWKSMESLPPRDWDSSSSRTSSVESPLRTFNSPYSTLSLDYSPVNRMADFKVPELMSPVTSDFSMFGLNRKMSSAASPTLPSPRNRFSTYETLSRRREQQAAPAHPMLRNNMPPKRDFIEELTKQLDTCQRRNQFLEAESVELDKERTQIRFEMRGLLVNNEDLLRMNTQLQGELKRMRDVIVDLESSNNVLVERLKDMEVELREAREVMVEANTQEYAFNFLQQSLKNKIQDAEDSLDKQTQHSQELSEKLWLTERKLEELEMEKDSKEKKSGELNSTVQRLETELAEALQQASQSSAELNLQQKLRVDTQLRVEELEETVLEKDQELLRLQQIVNRLQGEVSDKLLDKEQSLEDEIQLRERAQLQCKQAERRVEDLQMELQTALQTREDLAKQVKQAQEKIIDLETDLEEIQENEQRSVNKHKKVLEQCEQLQLKVIQEKDDNDKLECEKLILERQVRELRSEIEELHNNRVQENVVTKAEMRARELENTLRMEERSKVVMNNTISKLERKVNELSEQMDEEHKTSSEQKELMTQRIRSLKRQLNECEEELSRRESQCRLLQRELTEERESSSTLQKQLLDLQLLVKMKESMKMRQTLDSLKLDFSEDEEEDFKPAAPIPLEN
ncbi:uncharacterized protein LOC143487076 [Brachyhypopomus gauderio]|uniref:uncharacterized protein LOC143487076 n=1 Tax=Brachyhypopomus gauderio TaxID=698409 RepID=UPI0040419762